MTPLPSVLAHLRAQMREHRWFRHAAGALTFGLPDLDRRLPGGGLAAGCLHEVAGGGNGAVDRAAAACFGAGIAARLSGRVLRRWRVSVWPSAPLPVPGVGRTRWLVELIRARAGESFEMELEACDGTGRLGLVVPVADEPAAAEGWRRSVAY